MLGCRRNQAPDAPPQEVDVGEETVKVKSESCEQPLVVLDESGSGVNESVKTLRQRWELASVLNFLSVFEPIIGKVPKFSAEEIEAGLIEPDNTLAQLHIKLLKGIPPVCKTLESSDVWVTELRKKLTPWWPWVAEGQIPLKAAKGEEKSRYKELKPIERLFILKALCEVRLEQGDAVSFVNDALKDGTPASCFCKEQVTIPGNGPSYWYEADAVIGHRLYKAIKKSNLKKKDQGPAITFQWETLATNLDEFSIIADELASSKVETEVSLSRSIQSDMIPVLQKLQKNKERGLKKKERQNMHLNNFGSFNPSASLRSCRSRRPINYSYNDYDRAITDAIRVAEMPFRRKSTNDTRMEETKPEKPGTEVGVSTAKNTDSGQVDNDGDYSYDSAKDDSEEDSVDDSEEDSVDGSEEDSVDGEDNESKEDNSVDDSEEDSVDGEDNESKEDNSVDDRKPRGVRWSKRLAGETKMQEDKEVRQAGNSKSFMRQRPVQNSALDSIIVPDSDEEI